MIQAGPRELGQVFSRTLGTGLNLQQDSGQRDQVYAMSCGSLDTGMMAKGSEFKTTTGLESQGSGLPGSWAQGPGLPQDSGFCRDSAKRFRVQV
jgi:hypothetical protein